MRARILRASFCSGLILLLFATPAFAQAGPFIDWVFKLSGPELGIRGWPPSVRLTAGHQRGLHFTGTEITLMSSTASDFLALFGERAPSIVRDCAVAVSRSTELSSRIAYRAQLVHRLRSSIVEVVRFNNLVRTQSGSSDNLQSSVFKHICRITNDVGDLTRNPRAVEMQGLIVHLNNVWAEEDGLKIRSHQLTLEYLLPPLTITFCDWTVPIYFGAEFGIALHHFDVADGAEFYHWSAPVLLNWHPSPASKWIGPLRAGAGYHVFRPFDADAFQPLQPIEPAGVIEFVPTAFIEYDFLALVCSLGGFCL